MNKKAESECQQKLERLQKKLESEKKELHDMGEKLDSTEKVRLLIAFLI